MKKISEYLFLWGIGGWIYYSLEIIFRGFSHWSMFVLGGICSCMGLQLSAISVIRADLSAVYDIVCLSLCCWDLSECQYSAFVIWRRQTTVCEKNYPFKFKI